MAAQAQQLQEEITPQEQAEAAAVLSLLAVMLQAITAVQVEMVVEAAEPLTTLEHLALAVTALSIFTIRRTK
jgi:hypothetical protein